MGTPLKIDENKRNNPKNDKIRYEYMVAQKCVHNNHKFGQIEGYDSIQ